MPTTLTIRDELSSGEVVNEFNLDILTERMTVRELIRSRVYEEVQIYNYSTPGYFKGLVQPSDAEVQLNGYKLRKARKIDWEKQYDQALEAFQKNGFIILVNDHQAESLDEVIEIRPGTEVSFLKLVPLVGG